MKDKQLILAALAQLEREKAVSIPQLSRLLGVEEQRVYDALETLVFAYDAASVRLDLHDTYAILQTNGTRRLMRMTPSEADALVDALASVGFVAGDELVQKIVRAKGMIAKEAGEAGSHTRIITEGARPQVMQMLAAACEDPEHHVVAISYRGEKDANPLVRRVSPHRLISHGGHRYLVAYCHEAQGWRSFRIDRILDALPLEETATPPEGEMPPVVNVEHAGVKVCIAFDSNRELPSWQGMRVTRVLEDGARILEIPWTGSPWLPRHVVALMGAATPIDPPEFVDACVLIARKMLDETSSS